MILIIAFGVFLGLCLFQLRGLLFIIFIGLLMLVAAHSEPLAVFPDIDIKALCHEEADGRTPTMLAEYPELSEKYCIKFAKEAARLARARWAVLSEDSRKECLHQAKVHNSDRNGRLVISAYMTLGHCLGK